MALPAIAYRDPCEALIRAEAGDVYREKRCVGCASFLPEGQASSCRKKLRPGRNWCRGFSEK